MPRGNHVVTGTGIKGLGEPSVLVKSVWAGGLIPAMCSKGAPGDLENFPLGGRAAVTLRYRSPSPARGDPSGPPYAITVKGKQAD